MSNGLPSGEQIEIRAGDQRVVVVEVGGGIRSYTAGDRELLDGYDEAEMATAGRGQVLIPWPNRLQDGTYEFAGGGTTFRSPSPKRETRSTGSYAGPPGRSASARLIES